MRETRLRGYDRKSGFLRFSRRFLLMGILVCAGCSYRTSPAKRVASFAPHQDKRLAGELLGDFLSLRTAVVLPGEVGSSVEMTPEGHLTMIFQQGGRPSFGSAAAIDARGYFITAAHAVQGPSPRLLFLRDQKPVVEEARLVWIGDETKNEPDLAILCVPGALIQSFAWSSDPVTGEEIVGGGLNITRRDKKFAFEPAGFAGKLSRIGPVAGLVPRCLGIVHTAPVYHGDSGGPLVNLDGMLIGVNTGVFRRYHLYFRAWAIRPDLVWLRHVIDQDDARAAPRGGGESN